MSADDDGASEIPGASDLDGTSDAGLKGTSPQYPIGAVDRTLLTLELLAQRPESRLAEIRDHLGVGQSTAHRLMAMLVYRGFAEQDLVTRIYRAGPRLFEVGRLAIGASSIRRSARSVLEWLAEESGETAHLGVMNGLNVHYLDVIESSAALRVAGRVGRMSPAHATSLGKAMLSTCDNDALRRMYGGVPLNAPTDRTVNDLPALLAELARTRKRGWGRNRGEMESGVCSVGVAVVHPAQGLVGGLSIATPAVRSTASVEKRHAELLLAGRARLLEFELGVPV